MKRIISSWMALAAAALLLAGGETSESRAQNNSWVSAMIPAGCVRLNYVSFNAAGDKFIACRTGGFFRQANGSSAWTTINTGLSVTTGWSIDVLPNGDLWAATLGTVSGPPPVYWWRSTNNGNSWTQYTFVSGKGINPAAFHSGSCMNHAGTRLFYGGHFASGFNNAIRYTTDEGVTEQQPTLFENGAQALNQGGYGVFCDQLSPYDVWYGGETGGAYRSADGGLTFVQSPGTVGVSGNVKSFARSGTHVLLTSLHGLWRSSDLAGSSWNKIFASDCTSLLTDASGRVYFGTQHNTPDVGTHSAFISIDNGASFQPFDAGLPPNIEVMHFAIGTVDNKLYAASSAGLFATVSPVQGGGTPPPPPPPSDTTPPTVSITSPANGATVSGTITVSGTATDNVAVTNVQFKLDGANLGAADASAPYSASFDTTLAANGAHTLTAVATDTSGNSATSAAVSVTINNAPPPPPPPSSGADNRYCGPGNVPLFGAKDGPAQLPKACFYTALSGTPSPGNVTPVAPGGLQAALNGAKCGDILELPAGSSSNGSNLVFPAKNCDDQHWITVRTSAYAQLPPEGTRVSPCYAGVASLPNRPAYICPAGGPAKIMATLTLNPATSISVSGDHYRLIGLEITRLTGGNVVYAMLPTSGGSKIIFDRMWVHGTPTDETAHGVTMNDSHHIAVIDSYFNDLHCIAVSGACTDSQAVSGGNDATTTGVAGTFKVVNNFLEAAAENVLYGGGHSNDVPGDIEVRRNHLYKPMAWNPSAPNFIGTAFIVKNHYEMKNGQRALVEGNVMENVWAGFSQVGAHVLLTPKNQMQGTSNLCPLCQVVDVTLRYNHAISGGQALQIANGPNGNGQYPLAGYDFSIHDMLFENLHYPTCSGGCALYMNHFGNNPGAPPSDVQHDLSVVHITEVNSGSLAGGGFLTFGGSMPPNPQGYNMSIDNNIMDAGHYAAWSTGGTTNCATSPAGPKAKFDACWTSYAFAGNVMAEGASSVNPNWPAGNFFPADLPSVGFVNFNGGFGGDYHLAATSPYKGKATDGKDPGADIDCMNTVIAGGNVSSCGATPPDTTPPTVVVSAPANGSTVSGTIMVAGTAGDNVALAKVELSIDGGAYALASGLANWSFSLNTTSLSNASHSLTARATDASGNTKTASINVTVNNSAPPPVTVTISPSVATLASGGTQQFAATVTGSTNTAVTFSATKGSISAAGLFTAPSTTFTITATVKAASVADPTKSASASVTITGSGAPPDTTPPTVAITAPANGSTVSGTITISGTAADNVAVMSVQFKLDGNNLGALDATAPYSASFDTTLVANGSHVLTAVATDTSGNTGASASVSVTVSNSAPPPPPSGGADNMYCGPGNVPLFGTGDGPAQLPKACFYTALSATPSPGKLVPVAAGASVNAAITGAACGDTIVLQAGASYAPFTLTQKGCDASHWITIRTSAISQLPPEGTRISPCYAGVTSLPARPAYNCPAGGPANLMAKVITPGVGPAINVSSPSYYRLIGLEVTRTQGSNITYLLMPMLGADHIIIDRSWFHGTPQDELQHNITLNGANNIGILDSYMSDIHCVSMTGTCTDSQAVSGGNGPNPQGTWKIVNNFLEAAGENILFGGGAPGVIASIPHDIEIRRNFMFKPMTWLQGQPGYIGGTSGSPFLVKNLFELKNGERLLFEGNDMQNNWGGFSQAGFCVLLTPRGPEAAVRDITVRYSRCSHVGNGFQLAATKALNSAGVMVDSLEGGRWSFHDVVVDDMNPILFQGGDQVAQISSGFDTNPPLHDLTLDHITVFNDPAHGNLISVGGNSANPLPVSNIRITNSIMDTAQYPIWSTGGTNVTCPKNGQPQTTFNNCWIPNLVTANAIIGYPATGGAWPPGNFLPVNAAAVQFVNYNGGVGGDYHLAASSPYKNKGTDGKDLGADISCLNAVIGGARPSSCGSVPPPPSDTTPPTVAISAPANGTTVSGTITVSGTAADNVALSLVELSIDGGAYALASGLANWTYSVNTTSLANGPHSLTARATDTSGNTKTAAVNVTVNNSAPPPPAITVVIAPNSATVASGGTQQFAATVTGSTNTAVTYSATKGSVSAAGLFTAPSTTFTITATVTAKSVADPTKSAAASVTITASAPPPPPPDTTPPTVAISAPTNGSTVSGTITVSGTAMDNVAVASVQFLLDGANLGSADTSAPYSASLDTTLLTNGSHSLAAVATDTSGNAGTSASVSIMVSNAVSSASVSVTPSSLAFGSVVIGAMSAEQKVTVDNTGNVGVSVTNISVTGVFNISRNFCVPTQTWNGVLAPGTHCDLYVVFAPAAPGAASGTLKLSAAGTSFSLPLSGAGVDNAAPNAAITAPANGATVSGTVIVAANASDNVAVASVQFKLDGADLGPADAGAPYSYAWDTSKASEGSHTLTAVATDTSGNQKVSASVTVKVSHVNPKAAVPGLRSSFVYPDPALSGQTPVIRASLGLADAVGITIYDESGRAVQSADLPSAPAGVDAAGDYYYEFAWAGRIPSGIYYYIVHGKSADGTVVRARGRFAVVR